MNRSLEDALKARRDNLIFWLSSGVYRSDSCIERINDYNEGMVDSMKDDLDWINEVLGDEKTAHDGAAV